MRKSTITILAACAALLAGLVAPAASSAAVVPTTITMTFVDRPAADIFRGRVNSPLPACRENRLVRLMRAQPGDDLVIDTDRSEDNGSWSIDVEGGAAPGNYYARAVQRQVGGDTCATARSPRVHVGWRTQPSASVRPEATPAPWGAAVPAGGLRGWGAHLQG